LPRLSSRFAAAFGATLAIIVSWFAYWTVADYLDSRQVVLDPKTIRFNSLAGDWSVRAYNGSSRPVRAVLVSVTIPITEVRRIYRMEPRSLLGSTACPPYSIGEFRADFGGFLPDKRIHGLWKIIGVEFGKKSIFGFLH